MHVLCILINQVTLVIVNQCNSKQCSMSSSVLKLALSVLYWLSLCKQTRKVMFFLYEVLSLTHVLLTRGLWWDSYTQLRFISELWTFRWCFSREICEHKFRPDIFLMYTKGKADVVLLSKKLWIALLVGFPLPATVVEKSVWERDSVFRNNPKLTLVHLCFCFCPPCGSKKSA